MQACIMHVHGSPVYHGGRMRLPRDEPLDGSCPLCVLRVPMQACSMHAHANERAHSLASILDT